jgi:hypothetical protein
LGGDMGDKKKSFVEQENSNLTLTYGELQTSYLYLAVQSRNSFDVTHSDKVYKVQEI